MPTLAWFAVLAAVVYVFMHPDARFAAPRARYPGKPYAYRVLAHWFTRRDLRVLHRWRTFRRWEGGAWACTAGQWRPVQTAAHLFPPADADIVEVYREAVRDL